MNAAEVECRSALQAHARFMEWRSSTGYLPLADQVACQTRSAGLVITGVSTGRLFDGTRHASIGDLIMQAGRPVMLVPPALDAVSLERVVLGWKDTREARYAALDALPLLKKATYVGVGEIAAEADLAAARSRLKDVAAWLMRHGIKATTRVSCCIGDDTSHLAAIAREQEADIIVAGAYGTAACATGRRAA